jgi:hypothetical protein
MDIVAFEGKAGMAALTRLGTDQHIFRNGMGGVIDVGHSAVANGKLQLEHGGLSVGGYGSVLVYRLGIENSDGDDLG